jgi:hypothetical protein
LKNTSQKEAAPKPATAKSSPKPTKGKLRDNIEALVIAVILALFIRTFVVQAFKIPPVPCRTPCWSATIFWSTNSSTG